MPNQGRKQKPIPPEHTVRGWAEEITTSVLNGMGEQHRGKLPRELLVELAVVAYYADDVLNTASPQSETAWRVLCAAMAAEFGFTISFLSRVRDRWFMQRGADQKGNLPIEGVKIARPRDVENLMRHAAFKAWFNAEQKSKGGPPKHAGIAEFITKKMGFRCTANTVKKAMDRARKVPQAD